MKKFSIALLVFTLFVIPVFQANAAKVTDIRSYSEGGRTRIVFQLDTITEYHVKNTLEPCISLCLLRTELDPKKRIKNISSQQVESVNINKTVAGDLEIRISFKKKVIYDVFYFNSPFCVVIDVSDTTNVAEIPEGIELANTGESLLGQTDFAAAAAADNNNEETIATSNDISQEDKNDSNITNSQDTKNEKPDYLFGSITQFLAEKYRIAQPYIDIILMMGLIAVSIRIFYMNRYLKRNLIHEKNQDFADVVNEIQRNPSKTDEKAEVEIPITIKASHGTQGRGIKKNHVAQLDSVPKNYKEVFELAERGMDRFAISKKSNIPIGEVNLILDLAQAKLQGKIN